MNNIIKTALVTAVLSAVTSLGLFAIETGYNDRTIFTAGVFGSEKNAEHTGGEFSNLFSALLEKRLNESVGYRQAVLDRKNAELNLHRLEGWAIPYINVGIGSIGGTAGGTSAGGSAGSTIRITDEGLQPLGIQPEIAWSNLLGTDVSISVPVRFDDGNVGPLRVSASRNLFAEEDTKILRARAALIRAMGTEQQEQHRIESDLLGEVFSAYRSKHTLELSEKKLSILERELEAAKDPENRRSLEQNILRAQRDILQAREETRFIDRRIVNNVSELYTQALTHAGRRLEDKSAGAETGASTGTGISAGDSLSSSAGVSSDAPETLSGNASEFPPLPAGSAAVWAQEYTLAAAELDRNRRLLAYLPNPRIGFGLSYDFYEEQLRWDVTLQLSVTLLDRGERAMEAFRRSEQPEIERIRLRQARETLEENFRRAHTALELLEYDRRLQEYSLQDSFEEERYNERLYAAGFITEEAYSRAFINRAEAELRMEQIRHNIILRRLELLSIYEAAEAVIPGLQ